MDSNDNQSNIDEIPENSAQLPEENPFDMDVLPSSDDLFATGSKKLIAFLLRKKFVFYTILFFFVFFLVMLIVFVIESSGSNNILPYEGKEKCENVTIRYVPYNESEASSSETMPLEDYVKAAVHQYVNNLEVPKSATGISEVYYSLAVALRTEALSNDCTVVYRDKRISTTDLVVDSIFDANLKLSEGVILTDENGKILPVKVSDFCWNESFMNENEYKIYQANSLGVSVSFTKNYLKNEIYRDCACNKYTTVTIGDCDADKCFTTWPVESDEEEDPECYRAWLHQDDTTGYSTFGAYYLMMEYAKDYNEILRYFFGDFRYMTVKKEAKDLDQTIAVTNCSEFSLTTTTLTKEEFVSKVESYNKSSASSWKLFQENAEIIYDQGLANNVNPELIIVRPLIEGFSPGGSSYNYFGIGCTNEHPHCEQYSSFSNGILGFIRLIQKNYPDYDYFIHNYAKLGRTWYNPGNSSRGGCYYAKYIYPDGYDDYVAEACGNNYANCSASACAPVRDVDHEAYAQYQNKLMLEKRYDVFGISSDSCSNNTLNYGSCVLYKQNDSRWGSEQLGFGNRTLGDAGCAVTSVAIALTCTGEMDNVSNFSPSVLNAQLKANNGFSNGAIYWDNEAIRNFVPTFTLSKTYTLHKTDRNSVKIEAMKSALGPRTIGIVHIQNSRHAEGHFVVLQSIDEENNTILVLDPAYGETYVYSIYDVDGFKYYTY